MDIELQGHSDRDESCFTQFDEARVSSLGAAWLRLVALLRLAPAFATLPSSYYRVSIRRHINPREVCHLCPADARRRRRLQQSSPGDLCRRVGRRNPKIPSYGFPLNRRDPTLSTTQHQRQHRRRCSSRTTCNCTTRFVGFQHLQTRKVQLARLGSSRAIVPQPAPSTVSTSSMMTTTMSGCFRPGELSSSGYSTRNVTLQSFLVLCKKKKKKEKKEEIYCIYRLQYLDLEEGKTYHRGEAHAPTWALQSYEDILYSILEKVYRDWRLANFNLLGCRESCPQIDTAHVRQRTWSTSHTYK